MDGEHDRYFMFGIKKDKQKLHASYRIGRIIGDGNFAIVRECTHRKSSKSYALKIINKLKVKGKEHMIENEIHILRKIIHPNIVKLHEEFETLKEIYLVMELVTGGDLFDAIVANTRFSEPCSAFMIRDLASAVKYLHELNIVHRDIKPENLLVVNRKDGRRSIKLADFGLSIEVNSPMYLVCGTPTYVAPEILDESGYGLKVDVWAIGVICYILLCGFPPFRSANHDQEELFDKILRGDYEYLAPFWDDVANGPRDLIDCLLVVDANERYDAEEVLNHHWIKKWVQPTEPTRRSATIKTIVKNRKKFRWIAMAVVSFISLLKLVRSRRQTVEPVIIETQPNNRVNNEGPVRPFPILSRIPRPKPSAGLHIAEIRKSITTPNRPRGSPETSDRKVFAANEEYRPAPSPECSLKKGFLKREEAIKRVFRSDNNSRYYPGSQIVKQTNQVNSPSRNTKARPSSAVCSSSVSKTKTTTSKSTDTDSKRLFIPRPCKHANIFGSSNISYASSDNSSDSSYRRANSSSVNKSITETAQDVPVRKRNTSARLRPRSMIETTNVKGSCSDVNAGNLKNHSTEHFKNHSIERHSPSTRRMSLDPQLYGLRNKTECGCMTRKSVGVDNLSDGYLSRGYQTDSEAQTMKCQCSSARQSSRYNHSHTNLESQKVFSSGEFSNLDSANGIRKTRSSCRKIPRKPVFRHASSIQSLPSEKYTTTRKGLYRVKSLESNHATSTSKPPYKPLNNDPLLPPWNPSTNINSKPTLLHSPMSPKRTSSDRKSFSKYDKSKYSPKHSNTNSNDVDKGIKITTEVNKRKNIKFPDGKTVDEEVKTTTTVSVNNYPQEEECKETSLLAKVKNLAIEIGSLAKVTYNLSSESSSESIVTNGIAHSAPKKNDSDLNDENTKEETDRHSETEYLSAFRKN